MLRGYQQKAIDELYAWLSNGNDGHPCVVLPTGAGKSHVIAAICKDLIQRKPDVRILMLTHQKELIEQNAEKLALHLPNAPLGIYSAGIGKKQIEQITFAGVQSLAKKADLLGHCDVILIDECHLVSHNDGGMYRHLIAELTAINPKLRVIGFTATPYRLGHGLITDAPALFSALLEPVTIEWLVSNGYLAKLTSKATKSRLEVDGVTKRGGEYIESQLQAAVNLPALNESVVDEVIDKAGERKSWLFFCVGVDHAEAIKNDLTARGIKSACVTSKTLKEDRKSILQRFKAGEIQALTNANVLTTGFDAPNIDLIVLLRPTMSPGLYMQMAGRGLRLKSHTDHCLVLDFAGVVEMHGPITCVEPPRKKCEAQNAKATTKECPNCHEICSSKDKICPACNTQFPVKEREKRPLYLRSDDIMGSGEKLMQVSDWKWRKHTSKTSGKLMVAVTYYGKLTDKPVTEYLPIFSDTDVGRWAMRRVLELAHMSDAASLAALSVLRDESAVSCIIEAFKHSTPPATIYTQTDGKFQRVTAHTWSTHDET